jgi:hypothetical protein
MTAGQQPWATLLWSSFCLGEEQIVWHTIASQLLPE